ncbi:MAG: tryptophan synthase subunit beta, partial [Candidatus Eremiobacteraeota bacterium]|nr:tryptophan synthase subunit beta [Candidatus Eremiobacteraeota bacterium]
MPTEPNARGYFGAFGGRFVPEVLVAALEELETAMRSAFADDAFWREYREVLRDFVGRPSALYPALRFLGANASVPLLFKREDTNHTGA